MTRNIGNYITLLLRYYLAGLDQLISSFVICFVYFIGSLYVLIFAPFITFVQLVGDSENVTPEESLVNLRLLGEKQ